MDNRSPVSRDESNNDSQIVETRQATLSSSTAILYSTFAPELATQEELWRDPFLKQVLEDSEEVYNLQLVREFQKREAAAEREEAARVMKETEKNLASYDRDLSVDEEDSFDCADVEFSARTLEAWPEIDNEEECNEEKLNNETRLKPRQ